MNDILAERKRCREGVGIYFDPTKVTSGQRFFSLLCQSLAPRTIPFNHRPPVVCFNISGKFSEILLAKIRRQKVVLRVDGLYADRLSHPFISRFKWPFRGLLRLGLRFTWLHDCLASLANFLDQNYNAFARILLADFIIYQSQYSCDIHRKYFPKKPYRIIVNGSGYQIDPFQRFRRTGEEISLVTIHDGWKPSKRIPEVIRFVLWVNEVKRIRCNLTILGYTGTFSGGESADIRNIVESVPYFRLVPKFVEIEGAVREILFASDLYITFTYRDPCPNVVVEAMAHGLPVVGVASGGVPDIVGDAGVLLGGDDSAGFFSAWRFESEFPTIDFEEALAAVLKVKAESEDFRARVRKRFEDDLGIEVVAQRYFAACESLSPRCTGC